SLMLFDAPDVGGLRVSWKVIGVTIGATSALVLVVLSAGVQALAQRPKLGPAALVGQTAIARDDLAPEGQVSIAGEIWRAVATDGPVSAGAPVRVVDVQGLTLKVVKAGEGGAS